MTFTIPTVEQWQRTSRARAAQSARDNGTPGKVDGQAYEWVDQCKRCGADMRITFDSSDAPGTALCKNCEGCGAYHEYTVDWYYAVDLGAGVLTCERSGHPADECGCDTCSAPISESTE
jgi:hypothetical protein